MGKRRNNTAKTGDKAIYKGRTQNKDGVSDDRNNNNNNNTMTTKGADYDDDKMYNEVDHFHNEREQQEEYIRFDNDGEEDDDDDDKDLTGNKEAVLDLGVGGDESSSSEDDDGDDDDNDNKSSSMERRSKRRKAESQNDDSNDSDSDGESSDDEEEEDIKDLKEQLKAVSEDPRKWGKKKSMYYHGDTADLEIGQEEDDAFLEEEAAKEIQASRFQDMDEDDFVLSDNEEDGAATTSKDDNTMSTNVEKMVTSRDLSKLTKKEARKVIQKQHPELLPMVSYFADVVNDLRGRTGVAVKALMEGEGTAESVGATVEGQQYLLTKAMLQKSTALNAVVYLLLKSVSTVDEDGNDTMQAHPILDQLKLLFMALEKLKEKVEKKVPGFDEQLDTLVKAAALLNRGQSNEDAESKTDSASAQGEDFDDTIFVKGERPNNEEMYDSEEEDGEEYDLVMTSMVEKDGKQQQVLNEARFGLRSNESKIPSSKVSKKRFSTFSDDFGDMDEAPSDGRLLSSTINSIEQRSQVASRKRRPAPVAEQLDDIDEHDDRLAEGIKMMEEELGKLDGGEDGSGDPDNGGYADLVDNPDANDTSLAFYETMAKKNKSKKAFKKSLYQVAPKFPRSDALVDGERAISRTILKNRGLVAHKAKINRNPRVKKREQYRKALIRRKGAVREVRDGESHKYGGEGTGIKSGISRSRKLSSK